MRILNITLCCSILLVVLLGWVGKLRANYYVPNQLEMFDVIRHPELYANNPVARLKTSVDFGVSAGNQLKKNPACKPEVILTNWITSRANTTHQSASILFARQQVDHLEAEIAPAATVVRDSTTPNGWRIQLKSGFCSRWRYNLQ